MPAISENTRKDIRRPENLWRLATHVERLLTEEKGWIQASWASSTAGDDIDEIEVLDDIDYTEIDCLCLGGAIRLAIGCRYGIPVVETGNFASALAEEYVEAAGVVMTRDDGLPDNPERALNAVIRWNDTAGRTYEQVQKLCTDVVIRTGQRMTQATR